MQENGLNKFRTIVSLKSNPLCRVTLFINVKPMELCFLTVELIQFNVILG